MNASCPYYGRVNDRHQAIEPDSVPATGDVSICWACHRIGIFDVTAVGTSVRRPTPEEQAELDADPDIRQALAAMAESYTPAQALELRRGGR